MSSTRTTTDDEEPIITVSQILEQIEDEEEELDRERALYGNCDVDTCTYPQVHRKSSSPFKTRLAFIYLRDMLNDKLCLLVQHVTIMKH
jgi:hypothetical protein